MWRWLSLLLLLLFTPTSAAQVQQDNIIRLTLRPAAAPVPALKYQLLPNASELQPGNAALSYYRAAATDYAQHRLPPIQQAISDWFQAKNEGRKLPVPAQVHFVKDYWSLREIDHAARQEHCDWQLLNRVQQKGLRVQMTDVHELRSSANLLTLRFELELGEKDFAKALYTCQTGLAMGRHAAGSATLMGTFIGHGISTAMLDNVQEILVTPGSPNLYWALTELPRPWYDLRQPMQGENIWIEVVLDDFKDLERKALSLERLEELRQRLKGRYSSLLDRPFGQRPDEALTFLVVKGYPVARDWMLAQGKPLDLVERMPTLQVVLLYSLSEYRRMSDAIRKLHSLPYWEAWPHLERWQEEMQRCRWQRNTLPMTVMPGSYLYALAHRARLERKLDVLRTIEALRLYAAQYGEWPAALENIKEVLRPVDCYTGKPFGYRREGNKAYLAAPPKKMQMYVEEKTHYELTLAK